jgi:hypothetical protein
VVEARVVLGLEIADEHRVAGFELRDRRCGGVCGVDLRERQPRRTERVLVIHDLAFRDVHQAPPDRRERRRIGMRRLRIIDRPTTVVAEADRPTSGHGFPEELIVGQPVDALADRFVCLLEPFSDDFHRGARHDGTIGRPRPS